MEIAILGLGCFWGPEIKFSKLDGVIKQKLAIVEVILSKQLIKKYATGNTNHAEVVKLDFDPKIISYEKILEFFLKSMIQQLLNSQGPDFGTNTEVKYFI